MDPISPEPMAKSEQVEAEKGVKAADVPNELDALKKNADLAPHLSFLQWKFTEALSLKNEAAKLSESDDVDNRVKGEAVQREHDNIIAALARVLTEVKAETRPFKAKQRLAKAEDKFGHYIRVEGRETVNGTHFELQSDAKLAASREAARRSMEMQFAQ